MRDLSARALEDEQMDAAELDPATYARVLSDLAQVNRLTLSHRPTLAFVKRVTKDRDRFTLLDVGFGDGDLLRAIHRWADKAGKQAILTGVDLNPKSAAIATAASAGMGIEWITGDYARLGRYDLIVSGLVAHHMTEAQQIAFLRHMEAHATIGWQVNDVHRHRMPYLGYPLLARIMRWHRIVREDGTLSIARGYRPDEWRALLDQAGVTATVSRAWPYRLCVEKRR
jgi:2-polyprenyl-3-methyl-5-hydroxy-6-metoxy-1,4-benzoquinol methylase